jgi:hypothetical protein
VLVFALFAIACTTDAALGRDTAAGGSGGGVPAGGGAGSAGTQASGGSSGGGGESGGGSSSCGCPAGQICLIGKCVPQTSSQEAYIKASNTDAGDSFGGEAMYPWGNVGLSADGNTLAVGAPYEGSDAIGVGGDQSSNAAGNAGAVYVFTRDGNGWSQQAYVKASNTDVHFFGTSVALSADGNTLAVGAPYEDSDAVGVGGDQSSNAAENAGAVYVFTRSAGAWSQQAYVKASDAAAFRFFGTRVALAADGNTLAAQGILGLVYLFARNGTTWAEQKRLVLGKFAPEFGAPYLWSISLSANGDTAAVGGLRVGTEYQGRVYVFTRSGADWSQQAAIEGSKAPEDFGASVALSADGSTLAVGACAQELSYYSDTVYVFTRNGGGWLEQAQIKAPNTEISDAFGASIALSSDGNILAVGAWHEDSAATGVGGDPASNAAEYSGAAYVFIRSGSNWSGQAYVKASNTEAGDRFGTSVAISADGKTLAIGAPGEASAATGIDGDQTSNAAANSGAVYVF